jgi:pimeloyl-ACP methyl ester carboxylesterase
MAALTPTANYIDLPYGPEFHQRFDVYRHPVRDPGGNPCIIVRHPGGWATGDKRAVSKNNQDQSNNIATLCLSRIAPSDPHFDVISIETRQTVWDTPTAAATFGYNEPITRPAFFPESFNDMKLAIVSIKARASTLGIDPNKIILVGLSAGATMAWWSQLTAPLSNTNKTTLDTYGTDYSFAGGVDSRVLGVVAIATPIDFRKDGAGTEQYNTSGFQFQQVFGRMAAAQATNIPANVRAAASILAYYETKQTEWAVPTMCVMGNTPSMISGVSYTASTGVLSKTGAFSSFVAGDKVRIYSHTESFSNSGANFPIGVVEKVAVGGVYTLSGVGANSITLTTPLSAPSVAVTGASSSGAGYVLTSATLSSYVWREGDVVWITAGTNAMLSPDTAGQGAGAYHVVRKVDSTSIELATCMQRGSTTATSINFVIYPRQWAGDMTNIIVERVAAKPYTDPHDVQQYAALQTALQMTNMNHMVAFDTFDASWTNANTERVFTWMSNALSGRQNSVSLTLAGSSVQ